MNFKKLISLFLAVLMLCSALTTLSVVTVAAEEAATTAPAETVEDTEENRILYYHSEVFASPEEKLATMTKMAEKGNYAIYADQRSGEVAVKDLTSGQIMFTNPYDIGASNATENVKNRLMSQITVTFTEVESDNKKTYGSFQYAAIKDQIKVKNIKNGIRVEYTIGREEARRLVPRQIEKSRFEELILAPMEEYYGVTREVAEEIRDQHDHPLSSPAFYLRKQLSYYTYKDLDECESDRLKQDMLDAFPILGKDMDIYVLEPTTSTNELEKLEQVIKSACPNYSYEEMDYDHQLTEFTSEEENPPLFKMALEYTLGEHGFSVRLPANGIRFNESKFNLLQIDVLPYMGAGNNAYDGYAFFPDGSGALFGFEDMKEITNETITADIYGEDYAYHELDMKYQQVVRYPVYGIVENTRYYDFVTINDVTGEEEITTISGVIYDALQKSVEDGTTTTNALYKKYGRLLSQGTMRERVEDRGFAAIIEEGDALTSLSYIHEGTQAPYDTITVIANPRPSDQYNLADAISVGDNKTVTVTSERKYVGNYKIHYVMLSDPDAVTAEDPEVKKGFSGYEATWLGMGIAYRDYLVDKGILSPLSAEQTSGKLPLYIESFGAMETIEKILSIPVEVMRPLTSTEDIQTMYTELAGKGVTNINFKLTGYANGGMYATIPYGLKWEKAVSENMSMQELFDYAANDVKDGSLGLYPDFDFAYVQATDVFDGFNMRKHAVRTIDDRPSYKREYMATQQRYAGYFQLAVSPAYYARFYTKFMEKYLEQNNLTGISVGSLGNALNSDFDEDEPYNREDSKGFVTKALEYISGSQEGLEVMVDGGNAYTWQYVDHILGASLDSSRYIVASYSVPFLGVVLHGYKNFTGSPLNMEGDVNYAKLKAIENGASVYFTLSYQNTQNLKEDFQLSQYYSVRYDIWFDDVVEIYTELNDQLRDVQDKVIIDHDFLTGMRVPDTDELDRDVKDEFDAVMDFQKNQEAYLQQMKVESVADARNRIAELGDNIKDRVTGALTRYRGNAGAAIKYLTTGTFTGEFSEYMTAKMAHDTVMADAAASAEDKAAAVEMLEKAKKGLNGCIKDIASSIAVIEAYYNEIEDLMVAAEEGFALINETEGRPQSIVDEITVLLQDAKASLDELMGISFQYSTGNIEVDTFLFLHNAYLTFKAQGETNFSGEAVVGTLENIYTIFAEDQYGLYAEEVDFLRYLEANRNMSEADLLQKYGLKAGESSTDALVQYVRELLGDEYEFDPVLEATDGVGDSIVSYFKNKFLYDLKENNKKIDDDSGFVLKYFNINPQRPHNTRPNVMVSNAGNIGKVLSAIIKELAPLTDKKTGVIANVTDGNYDFDTLVSKELMDELTAKVVKILEDNERSVDSETMPIEYLTPETREADARNYIRSFYYFKVMDLTVPADSDKALLPVQTVESKTETSINLLAGIRVDSFGTISEDTYFADIAAKYIADEAAVDAILAQMNAKLSAYGDVSAELKQAYLIAFAAIAEKGAKSPSLNAEKTDTSSATELREEAAAILAAKLPGKSISELSALVDEIIDLHSKYTMKADYDVAKTSAEYVYYNYFKSAAAMPAAQSFYYNEHLAAVDAAVLAKVAEKKAEILAKLGSDFTIFELYEAVMAVLADKNDNVNDFVDSLAALVPYAPEKKGTIEDDILQHYCYSLFNCVDGYTLPAITDLPLSIKKQDDAGQKKNAIDNIRKDVNERIEDMLKAAKNQPGMERGDMPNYALTAFMTEEELTALADTLIDKQLIKLYYVDENADRDALRPEILDIVKHCFYTSILERLNATEPVDFNVYEVYNSSLENAKNSLKAIIEYYTLGFTTITKEDLDKLYTSTDIGGSDDKDEETSRYLSDDGRIVSVTYGTKNADGSYSAYKTFVLNYNNFSVNVEYEDVTYTIPAYGYVVVMN